MMKTITILISFYLLIITSLTFSQTVYEPINSSVYDFLDRMAQKGIIRFDDNIKPVSRAYIAEKLEEVKKSRELTEVEMEDLNFYLKDYGIELKDLHEGKLEELKNKLEDVIGTNILSKGKSHTTIFNWDPYDRWRLFSYEDNLFKLNVSPVLGYEFGTRDGAKYSHRFDGINMYGYLSNYIGFSFRFQDNSEDGTTIDKTKNFTPETGVIIAKADLNNIQYSSINTNITANWSWGDFTLGKDFINWGYGQSGLLVLSSKAPSFPYIRLDIHPVSWLRFNYIHAWLNSDVIDSSALYPTYRIGFYRDQFRSKFLAAHSITVTPEDGLDISLGESIVYSDQLQPIFLIPIMFFRAADHYLSQANNSAGGNSQFFMGISSRNQIKNTHLYGTLFIDEITLEGLFNPQKQRNQLGFTLGGSITDLPVDNLTFTLEYTKIYPYVYSHYIPTQTYQNAGYVMGDWIGNNADLIYAALNYHFIRGLQATIWGQYIRKGSPGTADGQYTQPQPPFLFGLRTNYTYFGFNVNYEIMHELFAKFQYQATKISQEQNDLSFKNNKLNEVYFSLSYGL